MPYHGVILLRPGHESPQVHVETIEAILGANLDFSTPFILVAGEYGRGRPHPVKVGIIGSVVDFMKAVGPVHT